MFWKRKTRKPDEHQQDRVNLADDIQLELDNVEDFIKRLRMETKIFKIAEKLKINADLKYSTYMAKKTYISEQNLTSSQEDKVYDIIEYYTTNRITEMIELMDETSNNMKEMYAELNKQLLFLSTKDYLQGVLDVQKGFPSDITINKIEKSLNDIDYHKNYDAVANQIESTIENFKI